ncbi:MAG: hypothetical protein IH872_13600 [Chloroflexi bacterium]|nr:hypothetical protein [Chloroflexota bacterium]
MRFRLRLTAPVAMAVFLVALVACGDDLAPGPSAPGLNTPDIRATVSALAQSQAQALTPTRVPESARQDLVAFGEGHRATSVDWDRFHQEMDRWREGVVACVPASVESALETFKGRALGLTQTARGIARLPNLETLAARLTAAVESEAAAFETLSDNWTAESGLTGGASLFQQLALARSAADLERGKVSRALLVRRNSVDDDSLELIDVFSSRLATLYLDWDQFHRAYDAFRTEVIDPEDEDAESSLGELLTKFGSIVEQVRKLPDTALTREIAGRLADAADGEQLLLRRLLSSDGSLKEAVPVLPKDLVISGTVNGDGSTNGNGGAGLSGLTLSQATVFDVFDTHVASVNQLRRAVRNELDDARASLSDSGRIDVSILLLQIGALGLEWDDFHDGYDEWRRTNGGCDQGQALDALGVLAADFGRTVRDIQALPSGPLVRGMGELLLQAAEREQAAVLSLRETWRSLDTSAFGRYSADRAFAETLRRQTALDLQDLLARQGIGPGG